MTVNVIYLTKYGVVHATDSLIVDGFNKPVPKTSGNPKIVPMPDYRGAASWFGFAGFKDGGKDWSANDWLKGQYEEHKKESAIKFGEILAAQLNKILEKNTGPMSPPRGMGVHFTFYETMSGKSIPELLWITNYNGITGRGGYKEGDGPAFCSQRQTFHKITECDKFENHGEDENRQVVYEYLKMFGDRGWQNGDNVLTNIPVQVVETLIQIFIVRRALVSDDHLRIYGKRALFRAEFAALAQKYFAQPDKIKVGAPCFNLMIKPGGEYLTDTPHSTWLPF